MLRNSVKLNKLFEYEEAVQWLLFYAGKTITSITNLLHNAEVIYKNKV